MIPSWGIPSDTSDKKRLKLIGQQEFWQDISNFVPEICRLDEKKCLC